MLRFSGTSQADPWGQAWEPLKLRSGRIGRDTGGMIQSLHVSTMGRTGFTLAFSKHYAKFFHGGTGVYGPSGKRISARGGGSRYGSWRRGGGSRARAVRSTSTGALAFRVRGGGGKGGRDTRGRFTSKQFFFMSVAGSPPRPIFPEGGRTPPRWRAELKATADAVLAKYLR
jgi:hypothetical protein